ncbi:MAG: ubiquinone biosynthesis protein UbiH [Novosphingobium sp. 28-62-57]|uniref:UbiH/UbiF/VisC/COQ6 family ubiquinone biosynthesis hydroxylase n=1 Tax=unclassified Novosphingobium TaxID=2644732 RepID=UPI000BD94AB1|nr:MULTISPECIES: UbiH/UbiF/VisC/COQ6 family ubiquinone biosynthesis hydroxylase [unclassified Novosphingobium]OYW47647.1 MAG: ubiquinone biosynthesis protein UbiH [Novosphingobium sp. 12-63-9]OYZ08389.1 MAG: ubiquinone biosynthesis protein UbiH [Novosphingobium sp. 28-62-57]OZA37687.1 MAG: ubiquinone biosynthesis protein UbiH [Novosphingobium sp. 17-62-9]HQS68924.1 UbiH/UbiF/VisC/COQ6 family ubiquinone biosynthesis hydroxylase [Novosphingobium sp.]
MSESHSDVVILGGGLVGMTLAIGLAKAGITSSVVDNSDPAAQTADGFDGRASAISTASWNLYTNLGMADDLAPKGCPIASIAVTDGMKPGRIDFQPGGEDGALGRMYANRDLRIAMYGVAAREEAITFYPNSHVVSRERGEHGVAVTLADGRVLKGRLLVAAEGRKSPTRDEAGFTPAKWDYGHRAIIAGLTHEKPHDNVAWEVFYPAGPFALLPLLDREDGVHRSSLVWTVAEKDAAAVLAMPDAMFVGEVMSRMHGIFGKIELASPRSSYPLNFHHTVRVVEDRLALVGDAAHGMHPIAGQGLNLGLRDVAALVEVLADGVRLGMDVGDAQLLARYERWRAADTFMVATATDVLTRLFGIPGKLPSAVRRLGMAGVQRAAPLKRWFMDEARGMSGDLPKLLRAA